MKISITCCSETINMKLQQQSVNGCKERKEAYGICIERDHKWKNVETLLEEQLRCFD